MTSRKNGRYRFNIPCECSCGCGGNSNVVVNSINGYRVALCWECAEHHNDVSFYDAVYERKGINNHRKTVDEEVEFASRHELWVSVVDTRMIDELPLSELY